MSNPAPSTAGRIIASAQLREQQRGFHSFSYRDVGAQVGIRTASIHYRFPTKADLTSAIPDRETAQFAAALPAR